MTEITKHYTKEGDTYSCKLCKKITTYASTMHYHIATKHLEEKPYNCTVCKKGFVQKSLYEMHLTKHIETRPASYKEPIYHCCRCSHTTTTKGNCLIHYARSHADWIPAYKEETPCKECDRIFPSSTAYLYHTIQCIPAPSKTIKEEIERCKQEEIVTDLIDLMTHLAVNEAGTEPPLLK
jgi:hypothetical protein